MLCPAAPRPVATPTGSGASSFTAALPGRSPPGWPPAPRDVICHTQTPAALGASRSQCHRRFGRLASGRLRRRPRSGKTSDPAELLHRQAGVPDLLHVLDLVVLELHHVD